MWNKTFARIRTERRKVHYLWAVVGIVVVVIVFEASAPKAYPRVALASANTPSVSVVRTLGAEKDFQACSVLSHLAWGTSAASVRLSAAPLYKGDRVGLRRGRGNWHRLSAAECDRIEGVQGETHPHGC